jgi:hypothetical protein
VTCRGETRNAYWILVGRPKRKKPRDRDLDVDGRIILKWFVQKWDGRACTVFLSLRIGTNGALLWTR